MSMLNFYINRTGKNLPAAQKRALETAKTELRRRFGRAAANYAGAARSINDMPDTGCSNVRISKKTEP